MILDKVFHGVLDQGREYMIYLHLSMQFSRSLYSEGTIVSTLSNKSKVGGQQRETVIILYSHLCVKRLHSLHNLTDLFEGIDGCSICILNPKRTDI